MQKAPSMKVTAFMFFSVMIKEHEKGKLFVYTTVCAGFLIRMNFNQKCFSTPLLCDTPELLLRVFIET